VIPILATISRTGVTLFFISTFFFIWLLIKERYRLVTLFSFVVFILFGISFVEFLFKNNELLALFFERTSDSVNDERSDLWKISLSLANENLLTGVGFENFYDYNWRRSVGLFYEQYDAETGTTYSNFISVHNSFIDLVLIGGIFLLFTFLNVIYYPIRFAITRWVNGNRNEENFSLALLLSFMLSVVLFSFTGQGATQKLTWFLIAVSYLLAYNYKNKLT
jgi:O-antigen ligase